MGRVEQLLLNRLRQPHSSKNATKIPDPLIERVSDHEESFQAYSSFTTNYKSPAEYENLLVAASKMRGPAVRSWDRREPFEIALVRSSNAPNASSRKLNFRPASIPIATELWSLHCM